MSDKKQIYDYVNYREFLRDRYLELKSKDTRFSFRYFSKLAGFSSSSVLKDVIDGRRGIAPQSIEKFVQALKLGKEEGRFFRNLVLFTQAQNAKDRQRYAEELLRSKAYKKVHPLNESQYKFFGCWYLCVIREMVSLKGFQEDPEWISKKLSPPVSPLQVKKAIEELVQLGMIERGADGRLIQIEAHLTTPDEVTLSAVAQYHREMMKRVAESIDRVPREKRELSAITLGMSSETAKIVKEMIQNFRKEVVNFISQRPEPLNAVYQINMHLVPLAEIDEGEKNNEKAKTY